MPGPVYMTHPTKALCPLLLEDMRKIAVEKKGETNFFTAQMIKASMKKVIAVNVHQTIRVDEDLEIKAYYAGHVREMLFIISFLSFLTNF